MEIMTILRSEQLIRVEDLLRSSINHYREALRVESEYYWQKLLIAHITRTRNLLREVSKTNLTNKKLS